LIERARQSASATVTVAQSGGRYQPLCAIYKNEFADAAEVALREGRYKINALFEATSTQLVTDGELESAGFSPKMFRNLNTPEELAEASGITNSQ
jgi:molybdopterin-guanine dinucleotide biosynthesis protein A